MSNPTLTLPFLTGHAFLARYNKLVDNAQIYVNWASLFFVLSDMKNMLLDSPHRNLCYVIARPHPDDIAWLLHQGFCVVRERNGSCFIALK